MNEENKLQNNNDEKDNEISTGEPKEIDKENIETQDSVDESDEQPQKSPEKLKAEEEAIKASHKISTEEVGRGLMRLRIAGLASISLCIFSFFVVIMSGVALYYWYSEETLIKQQSEKFIGSHPLSIFTNDNLIVIQAIHIAAGFLTVLFFIAYLTGYLNFHKKYTTTPLPGKARKPKSFITLTVGFPLLVLLTINLISGFVLPDRQKYIKIKQMKRHQQHKKIVVKDRATIDEIRKDVEDIKAGIGKKLPDEKPVLIVFLHTNALPVVFGILMLFLLIDTYSLQKSKLGLVKKKKLKIH